MASVCEASASIFSSSVLLVLLQLALKVNGCEDGQISPDPSNCSNYLQCNHNEQLVRPCPQGLYFNPAILACDWSQNVDCGGDSGGSGTTAPPTTAPPATAPPATAPPTTVTPTTEGCDGVNTGQTTKPSTPTTSTTFKPTTPPPTIPPPPSSPPTSNVRFAPYFDVNMNGPSLTQVYSATGQKDFTLAFALGSSEGCKPKWGGTMEINDPSILGPIRQIQNMGGQFIVATGGAMGPYFETLCGTVDELANAYMTVLDAVGTNHLDVDIESNVDADRMNKAIQKVQTLRPNTTASYTLMVQAEDYGLTPALGVDLLRNAKTNGVQVTTVNPMTMEFGGPSPDFGDSVIGAAKSVLQQMKQIWPEKTPAELNRMLGVTPMLGRNFNGKIFTLEHARKLVDWGNQNHIGFLAFWSVGRDNGNCAGGNISPSCSSIAQGEYAFTKIFQNFRG